MSKTHWKPKKKQRVKKRQEKPDFFTLATIPASLLALPSQTFYVGDGQYQHVWRAR